MTSPFDYWLLENPLPEGFCEAVANLPFQEPKTVTFSGKRDGSGIHRVFFTPELQENFEICRCLVDCFQDTTVRGAIENVTGADLSDGHLRIEYCQDTDGFWLEPHTDILAKKFTMLVYLSEDPNLSRAGTDIHEGPPEFKYVGSAPYGKNKGLVFVPGEDTWHAVGHHRFSGIRKSLIVNYVTSDWRNVWELA